MLISSNGKMTVCSQASQMTQHRDKELHLIAIDTTSFSHKILKYEGEQLTLFNARISDDGKYLVNLVQYSQPLLWDLHTGQLIRKLFDPDAYEVATTVAVSGSSMIAVTGTGDDEIKIWSIESRQVLRTIPSPPVYELYLSQDGEVIISISREQNSFDAWETKTGTKLATFMTDDYPNHVNAIGDKLALALRENPNLMILHLHRPGVKSKVLEEDIKSPYDGLAIEVVVEDSLEKPVDDDMDTDKDNDNSYIA